MASFLQVIWLEIRAPFNGEYIFWSVFLGYFLQICFAVSSSTKSHYSFENSAKETNFRQGPFINYIKANLDGFHKLKIPLEYDAEYWMNDNLKYLSTCFVIENSCLHC